MRFLLILLFSGLFIHPSFALSLEENSDGTTRTIMDFINNYIDKPPGAIDWKVFGATKEIDFKGKTPDGFDIEYTKPDFSADVKKLDGKTIIIKGFMFPLGAEDKQNLFLFGPFPLSCPYHYHVGPSLVVEVHADKNPIKFSYDPIAITGTLELVPQDPDENTFYRLKNAKLFK